MKFARLTLTSKRILSPYLMLDFKKGISIAGWTAWDKADEYKA